MPEALVLMLAEGNKVQAGPGALMTLVTKQGVLV